MSPRRHLSVAGVAGEILVTAGVIVLLFIGWQTWWNSWIVGSAQSASAAKLGTQWYGQLQQEVPDASDSPTASASGGPSPVALKVPVSAEPKKLAQPLAVIYIPRFGSDWKRTIRQGIDVEAVLNSYDAGVGHYPGTAMPGGIGNFAIAAHDTGYGNTFLHLSELHIGDPVYVQTPAGFYTYRFRNDEYVQPNAVTVLTAVPRHPNVKPTERLITLTTCNPPYHARERVVAYGVFESFSRTPPKAIAKELG